MTYSFLDLQKPGSTIMMIPSCFIKFLALHQPTSWLTSTPDNVYALFDTRVIETFVQLGRSWLVAGLEIIDKEEMVEPRKFR